MTKVSYTNLKLKTNNEVKTIEFNNNKIDVLQYVPIEDKIDLIDMVLQKAADGNTFNRIKLDMYFHLGIMYLYTNINFTDKIREDEYKLFDLLKNNGLLDLVLEAIPEEEYGYLIDMIDLSVEDAIDYRNTLVGTLQSIISSIKIDEEKLNEILDSVNLEKFNNAVNFAKAVGYNENK